MQSSAAVLWAVQSAYGAQCVAGTEAGAAEGIAFAGPGFLLRLRPDGSLALQVASGSAGPVPGWLLAALARFLEGAGAVPTPAGVSIPAAGWLVDFGGDGLVRVTPPPPPVAAADPAARARRVRSGLPGRGVGPEGAAAPAGTRAPHPGDAGELAAAAPDLLARWQGAVSGQIEPGAAGERTRQLEAARAELWRALWRLRGSSAGALPQARALAARLGALDAVLRTALSQARRGAVGSRG